MTASENEILASMKCSVLDENRPLLCANLDPKLHYPYLRSKHVISKDDEEEIESQTMTKLKVHKLLDILLQRSMGYDHLVTSIIQERTQIFLAKNLNKQFEEKKKRLSVLLTSKNQEVEHRATSIGNSLPASKKILPIDCKRNSFPRVDCKRDSFPSINQKDSSYCVDSSTSELESLPKPVMSNSKTMHEEYKVSCIESCENSFDEEQTSPSDNTSPQNESKA